MVGIARIAHPSSFVGAVIDSHLSSPVDATLWCRPCVLHGQVFRGDRKVAAEAYPFCLPFVCGLVHVGGPFHVVGWKFAVYTLTFGCVPCYSPIIFPSLRIFFPFNDHVRGPYNEA